MKYGSIACGHIETARAAQIILENGGNAFDAGIASLFASFLAEPCMSSAGGGGFALLSTPNSEVECLDFFCQTPLHKPDMSQTHYVAADIDYGESVERFYAGTASVGVPGSVAGIFSIYEKYASMPMHELVQPAIELAKKGVLVNAYQEFELRLLYPIFSLFDRGLELFYKNKKELVEGQMMHMPHQADFLDVLSREGSRWFYEGDIVNLILKDFEQEITRGVLTRDDFKQYKVIQSKPLSFQFNNQTIYAPPAPNLGGPLTKQLLELYASIEPKQLKSYQDTFSLHWTSALAKLQEPEFHNSKRGCTSHISVYDKAGNACTITISNGEGSGYIIPGTDVILNNMLGEPTLQPDGLHTWTPNVRLGSMMTPLIIKNSDQKTVLVTGTGGAARIPYALGQLIAHTQNPEFSLEDATLHPRIHFQDDILHYELDLINNQNCHPLFEQQQQWQERAMYFGGTNSIKIDDKQIETFADPRRLGVSISI